MINLRYNPDVITKRLRMDKENLMNEYKERTIGYVHK